MFLLNIWCKTFHQSSLLMRFLEHQNFTWEDGESLIDNNKWDEYKNDTCYYVNPHTKKVKHHSVSTANKNCEPILEFETVVAQVALL